MSKSKTVISYLANTAIQGKGFLKFELPLGANLGGMRHLGGGVFLGEVYTEKDALSAVKWPLAVPPAVMQCQIKQEDAYNVSNRFSVEFCDDPLAAEVDGGHRYVTSAVFTVTVTDPDTGVPGLYVVNTGEKFSSGNGTIPGQRNGLLPPLPTKITKEALLARIKSVDYVVMPDCRTTICQLTMVNGFTVRGESSCVSVEYFNKILGENYAYEKALDAAWSFEAYLLADQRHAAGDVA